MLAAQKGSEPVNSLCIISKFKADRFNEEKKFFNELYCLYNAGVFLNIYIELFFPPFCDCSFNLKGVVLVSILDYTAVACSNAVCKHLRKYVANEGAPTSLFVKWQSKSVS